LSAQERDIKQGLMQGPLPMSQWTSANLALFTAAELMSLGGTRFKDSPNRFKDCIYITELSRGEIDSLFPDEAALLSHRSKIEAMVQQAWQSLMPDIPDPLKTVNIYSSQKISAIRFFLNARQELIDIFTRQLDSSPFAGRMVFPGKTYFVNLFHRACPSLVRVITHPGDEEVDPDHIALGKWGEGPDRVGRLFEAHTSGGGEGVSPERECGMRARFGACGIQGRGPEHRPVSSGVAAGCRALYPAESVDEPIFVYLRDGRGGGGPGLHHNGVRRGGAISWKLDAVLRQ
jgi:hypothetical protein